MILSEKTGGLVYIHEDDCYSRTKLLNKAGCIYSILIFAKNKKKKSLQFEKIQNVKYLLIKQFSL